MIDVNSLTLEQAESFAYKEMKKLQACQQNLQILDQIIAQKTQQTKEPQPIEKSA